VLYVVIVLAVTVVFLDVLNIVVLLVEAEYCVVVLVLNVVT
jgi:hypothetical protein